MPKNILYSSRYESIRSVYSIIRRDGLVLRTDLSDETGLSPATVSRAVNYLIDAQMIEEKRHRKTPEERLQAYLLPSKKSLYVFSVHIDRDILGVAIVSFANVIIEQEEVYYECHKKGAHKVFQKAKELLDEMIIKFEIDLDLIVGVGVAMPGTVYRSTGILQFASQLGWKDTAIGEIAESIFRLPVSVGNDLKCLTYGEAIAGFSPLPESLAVLYIDTGVGSALFHNGNIFHGQSDEAGELGHIRIDFSGRMCDCGKRGCLQTKISKKALVESAQAINPRITSTQEIFTYMEHGYGWASALIHDLINYAALAIEIIDGMYNPAVVVVTGRLIEENEFLFHQILSRYRDTNASYFEKDLTIMKSEVLTSSILLGAGLGAIDQYIDSYDSIIQEG